MNNVKNNDELEKIINADSVKFEVAQEILGQELQPFITALQLEQSKKIPSTALIEYYKMRINSIDGLLDELHTLDAGAIEQILDKNNPLLRTFSIPNRQSLETPDLVTEDSNEYSLHAIKRPSETLGNPNRQSGFDLVAEGLSIALS